MILNSKEELIKFSIYDLRTMLRSIGGTPGTKSKAELIEEIVKIQVAWMEEFSAQFPKMAGNARNIHTYEDNAFNTSYETYLRGELGTYSEETFVLYGRFIAGLLQEGRNFTVSFHLILHVFF